LAYQANRLRSHAQDVSPSKRRKAAEPYAVTNPYDVRIPTKGLTKREIRVRRRAAALSRRDPERFFDVVHDAASRERGGTDPVTALEEALQHLDPKSPNRETPPPK
jgi:hypothetical protein